MADEIRTAQKVSGRKADVKVLEMDLSSLSSVEACVKSVEALNLPLHILVNNGGIYNLGGAAFSPEETLDLQSATRLKTTFAVYVSGSLNVATAVGFGGRCGCLDKKHAGSRKQTSSGYELHMATNHISHFSLTLRLLPLLRKSAAASPGGARIVNVSSHLHFLSQLRANDMHLTKSFSSQTAYANSKCAQVLATKLLRQQLPGSGVEAFAVHPGIVRTSITRSLPTLLQNGQDLIKFFHFSPEEGKISMHTVGRTTASSPPSMRISCAGARSVVYCATSDKAPDEAPDSWGYFSSDCTPMKPGVQARSETLASFVWRFSVHAADLPASLDISQKV